MTLNDQVRTALSNVGRRKLRSTLSALGVVVGTVTIVVMVSLASGVKEQINAQFASYGLDRLTVYPKGFRREGFNAGAAANRRKVITPEDVKNWAAMPGITKVTPEVNLPDSVDMTLKWNGTNRTVRMGGGFRPGELFQEVPKPVAGTLDLPDSGGMIISQGAAFATGVASNGLAGVVGKTLDIELRAPRGETQDFNLRVVGISQERSAVVQISANDRIAMKSWWFNSTNTLEQQGYDSVTIRAKDVSRANELSTQLQQDGFRVESLQIFMTVADRVVSVIAMMFTLIGSIALLVAAIGIANTMVMAIYERTREIGILKAMGASSSEIRRMFMLEAGFIGFIGGVAGLLIGWLLGLGLNQIILLYLRYKDLPTHGQFFLVTVPLALCAISFATVIGLVAGLLPAQRAARLDPLQALRHE
ncbi:MAG TPA: ABC transporter permease [Verrucomicrobiae bacterium]|jgi:putative ABC transport system permease protein